jgi:hypothetical protein
LTSTEVVTIAQADWLRPSSTTLISPTIGMVFWHQAGYAAGNTLQRMENDRFHPKFLGDLDGRHVLRRVCSACQHKAVLDRTVLARAQDRPGRPGSSPALPRLPCHAMPCHATGVWTMFQVNALPC